MRGRVWNFAEARGLLADPRSGASSHRSPRQHHPSKHVFKKFKKQILIGSALAFGVGLISLLVWVLYLDRIVTRQFEGRRWTLPAQVYAEPLELYVGQSFGADTLEQELRRLGYSRVEAPKSAGTYRRRGNRIGTCP